MSKSIKDIALIAAEWWADKITDPKFDNGADSMAGLFASAMAGSLIQHVTNDTRQKFIDYLVEYIEKELDKEYRGFGPSVTLSVDYGPCKILSDAAEFAGLSSNNFPWKTTMWIDKNHIVASYGYRGKHNYLYSNKKYWTSQIEQSNESIKRYKDYNDYFSYIKDEKERKKKSKELIGDTLKRIKEYKKELEVAEE